MSHNDSRHGDEKISSPFGVSKFRDPVLQPTERPRASLVSALLHPGVVGAAAFVLLLALAFCETHSVRFVHLNIRMEKSAGASAEALMVLLDPLTHISVWLLGLAGIVFLMIGLAQRKVVGAVSAVVILVGANVTTQVLKHAVFTQPESWGPSTLPSGHTTIGCSLGVAAILVAPRQWRRLTLVLAGFTSTYFGAATIVGQWHRPADTYAGYLVCLIWVAIVALTVQKIHDPHVFDWRELSWRPLLGAVGTGLVFVAIGVRPADKDVELILAMVTLGCVGVASALVIAYAGLLAGRDDGVSTEDRGTEFKAMTDAHAGESMAIPRSSGD